MIEVAVHSGVEALERAAESAAIHCAAFAPTGTRGWSEDEVQDLLRRDTALLLTTPVGFLLADFIGDEAEIISLAVHPDNRRRGIGHALLARFIEECTCRDVTRCILEVAVDNHAAITLYNAFDFKEVGIRPDYFLQGDARVSASVMEKRFEAS